MKRKIAFLLLIAVMATLAFSACAEQHVYKWIEETPATCTTPGTKGHFICTGCDKYFTVEKNEISDLDLILPATGHTEQTDAAVAPTCTEPGKTEGKSCSVCGEILAAQKPVPATGHTGGDWIIDIEAACETAGSKHQVCATCGETIATEEIPATNHTYGSWNAEIPATVTEPGTVGHYHCTSCGENFDADYAEIANIAIPPQGHQFGDLNAEIPATCTTPGTRAHYVCPDCQKIFNAEYVEVEASDLVIPALGHHLGDWIAETPANCGTTGMKAHYACTECGAFFDETKNEIPETELIIPINGTHDFSDWIAEIPATDTEEGVKGHYHCNNCQKDFDENYNELETLIILPIEDQGWSIVV